MKNKIIIGILALVVSITASSCKKFLDTKPEDPFLIETGDALKTEQDFQALLNSCYDVLRSNWLNGHLQSLSELMATDVNGLAFSGDNLAFFNRSTNRFMDTNRNLWKQGYFAAYRSNVLLSEIDKKSDFSADFVSRVKAEAKFIRALVHFDMVRMYAQPYGYTADNSHLGVPIRIEANTDPIPRSSVKAVYDQIIADLKEIENVLPESNDVYATKYAAKALLAKIYFQMNDYQNAYNYANEVIGSGKFPLENDLTKRFDLGVATEYIFYLKSTVIGNTGASAYFGNFNSINAAQYAFIDSEYLFYATDTTDLRLTNWFTLQGERYVSTKFNNGELINNPVLHTTEMLLIKSESAAELGQEAEAKSDLTLILERAGIDGNIDLNSMNSIQLITEIRNQRRKELVFEGNRLHELKRIGAASRLGVTAAPIVNLTIRGAAWDCPGLAVQLPDQELQGNPNIEANPQGGCN